MARNDAMIYAPNGVGFVLGCLQALLFVAFPNERKAAWKQRDGMRPVVGKEDDEFEDDDGQAEDDDALRLSMVMV